MAVMTDVGAGGGLRLVMWVETDIGEGLSEPYYVDLPDRPLLRDADRIEGDVVRAFREAYQEAISK